MADGTNSVDLDGMVQAHGRIGDAHGQLGTHLRTMSGQRDVIAGGWTGDASSTFLNSYDQWLEEMATVHAALGDMHDKLGTNIGVYGNTNDATIDAARAAGPGGGGAPGLKGL